MNVRWPMLDFFSCKPGMPLFPPGCSRFQCVIHSGHNSFTFFIVIYWECTVINVCWVQERAADHWCTHTGEWVLILILVADSCLGNCVDWCPIIATVNREGSAMEIVLRQCVQVTRDAYGRRFEERTAMPDLDESSGDIEGNYDAVSSSVQCVTPRLRKCH